MGIPEALHPNSMIMFNIHCICRNAIAKGWNASMCIVTFIPYQLSGPLYETL